MNENTHTFTLTSGVEAEVKELTGKHQRLLTEQKNKTTGDNINEVLADVIVRIGSNKNIDKKFVEEMLSSDRKHLLTEVRQFTMDFDPNFSFTYEYTSERSGKKEKFTYDTDLSEGFPKKMLQVEGDGDAEGELVDAAYKEYAEIQKQQRMILPKSKLEIQWNLLDGKAETKFQTLPKNKRSSHTAIEMRNPVKFDGETPIKLNLDNLAIKDIEALRSRIKEVEGQVDTEIMFEHPEAEYKSRGNKDVIIDVTNELAFYFPSEAI